MASEGDIFHVFGGEFKVEWVSQVKLSEVCEKWFRQEGVDSPEDFKRIWAEIHPRRGYDPEQLVYTHIFRCIAREE